MDRVRPSLAVPRLSWMCPCTDSIGSYLRMASLTALEPTGFMTAPPCVGRMFSSRAGASSRPVP